MPLPDAPKKSPRVYTLLQNTDLENVTFADIASIGNPVSVEELNEDTLRRLVLVNVARMCVAGEWNGLLTAGGGGAEYSPEIPGEPINTGLGNTRYGVGSFAPYGAAYLTTFSFLGNDNGDKAIYYPFIAPVTGTVSEFGIDIDVVAGSACNLDVGIYTDSGDGTPDTLQMSCVFDVQNSGTGSVYQTSITADVSTNLVRGTQYWIGFCRDTTLVAFSLGAYAQYYIPNVGASSSASSSTSGAIVLRTFDKPLGLVATESPDNILGYSSGKCIVSLKVA